MERIVLCVAVSALVCIVPQPAAAQSSEMPEPLAIVVDADGKPMVQVMDVSGHEISVLFNFGGVAARSVITDSYCSFSTYRILYFSGPGCTGAAYISAAPTPSGLDLLNQQVFVITGPHALDGTYRVFRSTSMEIVRVHPASKWVDTDEYGGCISTGGDPLDLLPAEKIFPNPLRGFHGPTLSNPKRILKVKGGSRRLP